MDSDVPLVNETDLVSLVVLWTTFTHFTLLYQLDLSNNGVPRGVSSSVFVQV